MLDGSAKAWGWLALRVLLAVALVLAGHFSNAAITALKPALAWGLTKAAPDCQFLSFQLGQDRNQTVLGAVVRQQRTLVLGGPCGGARGKLDWGHGRHGGHGVAAPDGGVGVTAGVTQSALAGVALAVGACRATAGAGVDVAHANVDGRRAVVFPGAAA